MKILMVCLGNICRSPLAQGILESKLAKAGIEWEVDSAGTSAWHADEKPDERSIMVAKQNGVDITMQRARQFVIDDFKIYDYILTMDTSNYNNVRVLSSNENDLDKVKMILNYSFPGENRSVPDPYYDNGFDKVYDMLDEAIGMFIDQNTKNENK